MGKILTFVLGCFYIAVASPMANAAPSVDSANPNIIVGFKDAYSPKDNSLYCPDPNLINVLMSKMKSLPSDRLNAVGVSMATARTGLSIDDQKNRSPYAEGSIVLTVPAPFIAVDGLTRLVGRKAIAEIQAGAGCAVLLGEIDIPSSPARSPGR